MARSTVIHADGIAAFAKPVATRRSTHCRKSGPEQRLHYAFGTVTGAEYGVCAEHLPIVTAGAGTLYGAGVWLTMDELALSALGLSKPPTAYPPSLHAYSLGAHLIYGATLEVTRRIVRKIL